MLTLMGMALKIQISQQNLVSHNPDFTNGTDCDDTDAKTYPSAPEICDEVDNDCNSIIDDILDGIL